MHLYSLCQTWCARGGGGGLIAMAVPADGTVVGGQGLLVRKMVAVGGAQKRLGRNKLSLREGEGGTCPPPSSARLGVGEGGCSGWGAGWGGGGPGTQKFVYPQWPNQIFPIVNFIIPHDGHFGRGGGGELLLWLSAILIRL